MAGRAPHARADDNHAAPSEGPEEASPSLDRSPAIQARVGSSRIVELSHMFLRLCGPRQFL